MQEDSRAAGTDSPLAVLWRRRWIVIATFVVGTVAAAIVSKSLDPVYSASSRLLVVQSSDRQSFDAVQAAQVTARTYADILDSPNIARQVARRLGGGVSADDVQDATEFEPIPETQLLRIRAEWPTAQGAQAVANTYAAVFDEYARTRLRPTTQASVSIADLASFPVAPARPKPTLYTLLAGLLALALGIALAFVRDRFDTRVEGAEDLERSFGLPTLARVPRRDGSQDSPSRFAEAFRMLRVAIAFSDPQRPPRSVVVTSAAEGEGKTSTVRQLGLAAAEAGQAVILVEADVYRPALARALNVDDVHATREGLTGYLLGQVELDDVIVATGAPNLRVVAAGPSPASLSSLLESERGVRLIDELVRRADLVIVDCPPLAPRADAAVVAARADATLLVVDAALSQRRTLHETIQSLRAVRANLIGVVLNRTATGPSYYSTYHAPADGANARQKAGAAGAG